METDRLLYQRARAGDREAITFLFDRHCARLLRQLRRRVDRAAAEDVAQETWLIVFRGRSTWRGEGSFAAWLFTIARREALRQQRIAERCGELVPRSPTRLTRRILIREVVAAIRQLDNAEQRQAASLYWLHDHSGPEIADLLDVPLRTVQSRLRLAKLKLIRALTRPATASSTR